MRKTDWLVVSVLALCATGLVACGGSRSGGSDDQAAREEAGLEFAQCMREHGVDMPDPQPGQGGGVVIGGPGKGNGGIDPGDPATEEAMEACDDKLKDIAGSISPEKQEEFKEQALDFAQCMREHGVDMPDPQFDGAGKVTQTLRGEDPNSPAFREAQEACQGEMPGPFKAAP